MKSIHFSMLCYSGAVEKSNIVDLLISQMESYTADLERMVEEKTLAFQEEKTKADALLNQILPSYVVQIVGLNNSVSSLWMIWMFFKNGLKTVFEIFLDTLLTTVLREMFESLLKLCLQNFEKVLKSCLAVF